MWFITFALVAATCISILVYGWATYLERAVAATPPRPVATVASPPLPPPKAKPPQVSDQVERVREPKIDSSKHARWSKGRKSAWKARARSRQARGRETW